MPWSPGPILSLCIQRPFVFLLENKGHLSQVTAGPNAIPVRAMNCKCVQPGGRSIGALWEGSAWVVGPLSMERRQGLSRVQDFLKSSLVRLQQPPPFGSLEWESEQRDDWLLVTQSTFVPLGFIRKKRDTRGRG